MFFSVIIPAFNRKATIKRAIDSVNAQSFKDFEVIIVDDGSTDFTFEYITTIANNYDFPLLCLRKNNGGVHTARNLGINKANSSYCCFLDSDDELKSDCLENFYQLWNELKKKDLDSDYFEVKALCENESNKLVGKHFPNKINEWPWSKAKKYYERKMSFEHLGCRSTSILKENKWPEPIGITYVGEDILWHFLRTKFKSYFSNKIVRIYHTESGDSLTNDKKRTLQKVINALWNSTYRLNNKKIYWIKNRLALILRVVVYRLSIKKCSSKQIDFPLTNRLDKMGSMFLYPLAFLLSKKYIKTIKC